VMSRGSASGAVCWRSSRLGYADAGDVEMRLSRRPLRGRSPNEIGPTSAGERGYGTGAGGRSSQPTMLGVVQTSTGGLDVALPPMRIGALVVVHHGVQAGQAGAGGEKNRQKQERIDPEGPAGLSPIATPHGK
jgi:hypothetical protein